MSGKNQDQFPLDIGSLGRMLGAVIDAPSRKDRRITGSYYTPRPIVRFMCREALKDYLVGQAATKSLRNRIPSLMNGARRAGNRRPRFSPSEAEELRHAVLACRVCDPSAGAGAFLLGMLEEMVRVVERLDLCLHGAAADRRNKSLPDLKKQIVSSCLFGVDVEEPAVRLCAFRLSLALMKDRCREDPRWTCHVVRGDGLSFAWSERFSSVFAEKGGFDLVLGNPPFVNMVEMDARPDIWDRDRIRSAYETARGGFDLYVPFHELAVKIIRPGGVVALLTPNKMLSAEYARPLRQWLTEHATLRHVLDVSHCKLFGAGVYPVATFWRKHVADNGSMEHRANSSIGIFRGVRQNGAVIIKNGSRVPRHLLARLPAHNWTPLIQPGIRALLPVLSAEDTLESHCTICGGATVSEAYEIKDVLAEGTARTPHGRFLVSGNIGRYHNTWGVRPTRYIGDSYHRPVLPASSPVLSATRRREILLPKIIVSGMARRPHAFLDRDGRYAAGKSTVILYDADVDLAFLCGLLNSSLYRLLYQGLFGTLSLSGGYLRFGPPQVRQLPVRIPPAATVSRVSSVVLQLQERLERREEMDARARELDVFIDRQVLALYGIAGRV